ncbi:MAG: V4R domain-containing protein [Deltaproteobacteria bacterium]|nr:V4R domain-containing protein [Deltaproteobacteria bacterium]
MLVCFDPNLNIMKLDGVMVSLHCHHYNCGLVKALEEIAEINAMEVFVRAATEEFYLNFNNYILSLEKDKTDRDKLEAAVEMYRFMGFGRIDISQLNETGGKAWANSSYYVVGWLAKYGRRQTPVCYLTRGFLAGILAAIYGRMIDDYKVEEDHCMITGCDRCEFTVSVNK